MVLYVHIVLLILEIIGYQRSSLKYSWKALVFYTQISNLMTAISSVLVVIFGHAEYVTAFRFISCCFMCMTFFVTTCILIPMGGDFRSLLFKGTGLYFHLLCPVISVVSYLFLEDHADKPFIFVSAFLTLIYGIVMVILNKNDIVEGPYPFFMINKMGTRKTVIWLIVLFVAISFIRWGLWSLSEAI